MAEFETLTGAGTEVFVNIYDLHMLNRYVDWMGLGAYHCGIEVYQREYSYGKHDSDESGVFQNRPRAAAAVEYRTTVPLGETDLTLLEVMKIVDELSRSYTGTSYEILERNCNNFCDVLAHRLVGRGVPEYVFRLPAVGRYLRCCLPKSILDPDVPYEPEFGYTPLPTSASDGEEEAAEYSPPRVTVSRPISVEARNSQSGLKVAIPVPPITPAGDAEDNDDDGRSSSRRRRRRRRSGASSAGESTGSLRDRKSTSDGADAAASGATRPTMQPRTPRTPRTPREAGPAAVAAALAAAVSSGSKAARLLGATDTDVANEQSTARLLEGDVSDGDDGAASGDDDEVQSPGEAVGDQSDETQPLVPE